MRAVAIVAALTLAVSCFNPKGTCVTDSQCSLSEHCSSGICMSNDGVSDVGGRCNVNRDCVTWATCVNRACALAEGLCADSSDCSSWEKCAQHVCDALPGRCNDADDCPEWRFCSEQEHACGLAPGRCEVNADCSTWQYCESGAHRCQDVGVACANGSECADWQTCVSGHCANQTGRCGQNAECDPTWQVCTSHRCVPAPGKCATVAECDSSWQFCSPSHVCTTEPGRCGSDSNCDTSWQLCQSHVCVVAPGKCSTDEDCSAPDGCSLRHSCVSKTAELYNVCGCTDRESQPFGLTGVNRFAYQTFLAGEQPVIESIDVALSSEAGHNFRSDVTVSLFRASGGFPTDVALASTTIEAAAIDFYFTPVTANLRYSELEEGKEYAIVLGQQQAAEKIGYKWCFCGVTFWGVFGYGRGSGDWQKFGLQNDAYYRIRTSYK